MKYTAIYIDRWQSGSHHHSSTKFLRFIKEDNETVLDALKRHNIADNTIYLFEGHPKLQGEE